MIRVAVNPEMLRWAKERSGVDPGDLDIRFPKLPEWERQERQPTLKQLERFAKATRTPIGYLFLPQPPVERIPIPDFRTLGARGVVRPGPNLLDTIYLCQQRQDWYRDYARTHALVPLKFIGSVTLQSGIESTAEAIRRELGFDIAARRAFPTWEDALRDFISQADAAGIMVMCSGVVGNNNHRRLDPEEFRGFALSDPLAPLVYINGADSKSAQMFTLAHELAHVWLGQSALTDADVAALSDDSEEHSDDGGIERWCNAVAAEVLVPFRDFTDELRDDEAPDEAKSRLARVFKVSTLVVLRRLWDAGQITRDDFWAMYNTELDRLLALQRAGGGNFYLSQAARVSKRFARALMESTLEGQTPYRDAMRMVGVAKVRTFHELGRSLGMPV